MTAASPFLDAVTGGVPSHMPVWFMRQAGRALAEYRAIRERHSFEQVVHSPELTAEVTLQPIDRYGVDAAILFSDIVTPLQAIGLPIRIVPGTGPVLEEPIRRREDLARLRPIEPDVDVPYVLDAIRHVVGDLPSSTPLIGFAGAPFTLASYLVEGRPSRTHAHTKALMRTDPETWDALLSAIADIVAAHLMAQVEAGARAVQLFDSWAGVLAPADYEHHVAPHSRRVLRTVGEAGVPRVHFGVATGELLALMGGDADVVGVDWRVPLDEARRRIPAHAATQGNLDPTVPLAGVESALAATDDVLARVGSRRDHVFNLGHGVLPSTDPGVLAEVVAHVHAATAATAEPAEVRTA